MKTPQQLLQQTLEVGACLLPDAASGGRTPYPAVFVHGLLGWGARDALYRAVPYWGLAAGDVLGYLNACGYDCRAASVGIISSAWDRACELYAELTGGTADYGITHAQRFGHARFGAAYPAPLVPDWGADKPLTSWGTASAARRRGCSCSCSRTAARRRCRRPRPRARRHRRCSPAARRAGCTHWWPLPRRTTGPRFSMCSRTQQTRSRRCFWVRPRALGISAFKGVYDFRLDQFGIRRDPDEPLTTAALRMLAQNPLPAGDNAFDDLRPAGARALNARIRTLPDTWYFSIPCCRTLPRLLTHDQKPDTAMTPLLWPFSAAMGRDSAGVPRDWLPNDGLVNTISARYPAGAPHADFAPGQTPERGVWQVLPVEPLDHLAAIGGVLNTGVVRTRRFYRSVMALLDAAAAADSAHSCEVCPKPGILS